MVSVKYLGLLGLHKLMKQHPKAVAEHKDLIIQCLTDDDVTIRMRALDLIASMVSQKNIKSVVAKLVEHLQTAEGNYKVISLIIFWFDDVWLMFFSLYRCAYHCCVCVRVRVCVRVCVCACVCARTTCWTVS